MYRVRTIWPIITTRTWFSTGKDESLPGNVAQSIIFSFLFTICNYVLNITVVVGNCSVPAPRVFVLLIYNYYFRYRKFNLFSELGFNQTDLAELCTFDTDFGVRFGMFICFDIMFQDPAVRLVRESGVKDIIFSAAWFSELPLLTG